MKAAMPAESTHRTVDGATGIRVGHRGASVRKTRPRANRGSPIAKAWTVSITRTHVISPRVAPSAEPRTCAHEDSADKVVGSPISDWGASIRIIRVVAVSTNRLRPDGDAHGAYANAHGNLSVCAPCGKKQNSPKCCIF